MECLTTTLKEAKLIKPKVFGDHRGFFLESWRQSYEEILNDGKPLAFVQDNHSMSIKNVLRGLHFQLNYPQGKLVRAIVGEVYDAIVDLRPDSPTFGHWEGFYLSAENKHLLWVPPGFAHGFYTMSDKAEILYKCTEYYHPEDDYTLIWNDKDIGIQWPFENKTAPALSEKDSRGLTFKELPIHSSVSHE